MSFEIVVNDKLGWDGYVWFVNTLGNECELIKIIDVGAMIVDSEPPDYHALLKPGVAKVIGFEL